MIKPSQFSCAARRLLASVARGRFAACLFAAAFALLLGAGATEVQAQTAPTVSSAGVNGATLTITFSEALDGTSTPANDAFAVNNTEASGLPFPIAVDLTGTPSISGSTVTLTLENAVTLGDAVTVSYTKPTTNPLRASATGNTEVATFTDQAVTNNTVLMVSSAWVSGDSLTIAFNANLDDTSTPANAAFTVKVGGTAVTLSGMPSILDRRVTLTLESAVSSTTTSTVTVSYTKPTSNPLRASATGKPELASFTDQAVDTPPNVQSAVVDGDMLTVTFDETLDPGSTPAGRNFIVYEVKVGFQQVFGQGTASISGRTATVTLERAIVAGAAITVNYTRTLGNPLKDASGNQVPTFSMLGTNNTPEPEMTPPTLLGGTINESTVRLYFSEPMDTASTLTESAFTLSPSSLGAVSSPTWATDEANILTLTTATAASAGQADVEISITTAAGLQDVAENDLAAVTSFELTNLGGTDPGAPTLSTAEVDGDTLTLTYDQRLLPRYPPRGDFTVSATGTTTVVSSLAINPGASTSTVVLTLSTPVKSTDTVTVSYSKATAPRLQNEWGGQVAKLTNRAVTNNTAAPVYTQPPARIWSARLTVRFSHGYGCADRADDAVPCTSALTDNSFRYEGTTYRVTWVYLQGSTDGPELVFGVDVDLENVVSRDWTLHVGNRRFPVADATLTSDGGHAAWYHPGFDWRAGQRVWLCLTTGGASCPAPPEDSTPPRVSDTPTVTGATLTIDFNEQLRAGSVPPPEAFEVVVGGGAAAHPSAVGIDSSGLRVILTLATAVARGETVEVRYTPPAAAGERLRDSAGNAVASFTLTAANNPPAGSPVADAGADLMVEPGETVTLDGSGSADPEGEDLAFAWTQVSGAPVTLDGADTATASFAAPDSPVALAFRLTVTDPGGLAAIDRVTVTVRDRAPAFGAARVAALTLVRDEAMDPVVLPEATGGNGELSYGLTSEPAGLAGLSFDPATRTLSGTPTAVGRYEFALRADDADDNRADADAAVLTFRVTVLEVARAAVKRALERTLAAVGRSALASARDSIGARFAASVPMSGLTLGGETVPFGAVAGSGAGGAQPTCAAGGFGRHGLEPAFGKTGVGTGHGGCAPDARSRVMEADALLSASAFSLTLGAAEGPGGGAPSAPLWSVWGRGDLGTFAGRPEPAMRYDGELRTGWLGVDARAGAWVAGLAVSHAAAAADYRFAGGDEASESGRLETTLTALYPYGRWTLSDSLQLRGVLGAGYGEARHSLGEWLRETSTLTMLMASMGARQELPPLAGVEFAVRTDASLAHMETASGPDYVDGLTADSWLLRAGLEVSSRIALAEESALTPFMEAAARSDGGDDLEGFGLEVVGGLRYTAPRLQVEARGRWLAAHSQEGTQEHGVSVTARVGPGASGRGLSLMLSPRWGAGTGPAEALWRDELPTPAAASGGEAAAMDARIGYGFGVAPYGLLTPFAEAVLAEDASRLRLGTRFEASHTHFGMELAGERREGSTTGPEHALTLDARLRF